MTVLDKVYLIGESAAAGYLYAPDFTPAKVLQRCLRVASHRSDIQVIDSSRTSETLAGLVSAAQEATASKADALVVFAGNNWTMLETPEVSPYIPHPDALRRYGRSLSEHGLTGPIELASRLALERSFDALSQIATLTEASSTTLLLVVPEVNLADWHNRQPPVWLEGRANATWYRLHSRALRELEAGRADLALSTSRRMTGLDGCTCPTSFRLAAIAQLALGDLRGAESALRAEVEANQYSTLGFLGAPQASRMAQSLVRRLAARCRAKVVDLPKIFAAHTGSIIPGRRLFLDYCHLTTEGAQVAMAAISAELLDREGLSWRCLLDAGPRIEPSPQVDASAKLGAALHTAHRMSAVTSKSEILEYWCREALTASPGIAESMLDVVDERTSPCPAPLSHAHRRNQQSDFALGFQQGWRYEHIDAGIIRAILSVLDDRRKLSAERLVRRLAIDRTGIDLSRSARFLEEPVERFFPEVMPYDDLPRTTFFRAPWPSSKFAFVSDARNDLDVSITARRPRAAPSSPVRTKSIVIEVGAGVRSRLAVAENWTRSRMRVPRQALDDGLNTLRIEWPMVETEGQVALATAFERLERGFAADIHPVFGEIFELRIEARPTFGRHTRS